jgi:hypothetical protein
MRWTINPITSAIRFDMTAQPGDVGDLIQVFGTTRQALVLETDVFPVSDTVVDQLVAAVAQRWMQVRRPAEYSEGAYETALAAGLRWSRKEPARQSYGLSRVRRR